MIHTIPTTALPRYRQQTTLDGRSYTLAFDWRDRDAAWYLDLYDAAGDAVVEGIRVVVDWPLLRLVTAANRPPGELYAIDTTGDGDPGREDLGGRVVLVYADAEEVG